MFFQVEKVVHSFVDIVDMKQKIQNKMMRRWKKEKSFAIKTSGYHTYFGMASSALNNDGELVVKEDATKAEIKRAFAKSLKGKKMNKKILSEFIELVA